MNATLLVKKPCELGEGPMWYKSRNSLFWVDIVGKAIHEYVPASKQVNSWNIGYMVSLIIEKDNENLQLCVQGGIISFNLVTKEINWLAEIEKENPQNRTNDGGIDGMGNIWIGTMEMKCKANAGALYVIDKDFNVHQRITGLSIPNGLVFTPDQKHMYHIDSTTQRVESYAYDGKNLTISHEKTLIQFSIPNGGPDGMTMDEEGMLWIAEWGEFRVTRWDPATGKKLATINVPVPQPSACIFGGENMDQLYITSAFENLSAESLQKYPDSGCVFVATPGVRGIKK